MSSSSSSRKISGHGKRSVSSPSSVSSGLASPYQVRGYRRSHSKSNNSSQEDSMEESTTIVQVANIAPQVTKEMMEELFGHLGTILDLTLYPMQENFFHVDSKIGFVQFRKSTCVSLAQRLTNTVLIDRALIVIPYFESEFPDESKIGEMLMSGSLLRGVVDSKLPQHVTSYTEGAPPVQIAITTDPTLAENNLPMYPPLYENLDSRKISEIRRTLLLCNLPLDCRSEQVLDLFASAGVINYFRFCTRSNDPLRYALIEFSQQESVIAALKLNGTELNGNIIRVYHSTEAIVKPQAKSDEVAQREVADAIARQAQNMFSDGINLSSFQASLKGGRRRSPSHSPNRRVSRKKRSRSRSSSRRKRSRSISWGRRSRSSSGRRSRHKRRHSRSRRSRSSHRSRPVYIIRRNPRSNSRDSRRRRSRSRIRKDTKTYSRDGGKHGNYRKESRSKKRKDRKVREDGKKHSSKSEKKRRRRSRSNESGRGDDYEETVAKENDSSVEVQIMNCSIPATALTISPNVE